MGRPGQRAPLGVPLETPARQELRDPLVSLDPLEPSVRPEPLEPSVRPEPLASLEPQASLDPLEPSVRLDPLEPSVRPEPLADLLYRGLTTVITCFGTRLAQRGRSTPATACTLEQMLDGRPNQQTQWQLDPKPGALGKAFVRLRLGSVQDFLAREKTLWLLVQLLAPPRPGRLLSGQIRSYQVPWPT